jgi:hypothetical protein
MGWCRIGMASERELSGVADRASGCDAVVVLQKPARRLRQFTSPVWELEDPGLALTRIGERDVARALKLAGKGHGPGTVAKALAHLTAGGW